MRFPLLLMIIAVALLPPQKALADGVVFGESFLPLRENEQRAAIAFHDNVQKMVLAINYHADEPEKSLWIFPVAAPADAVKVDLVDAFPLLGVFPMQYKAYRAVWIYGMMVRANQIYTVLESFMVPNFGEFGGVNRYEEVEKHGIRAEVVAAESQQALARYLKAQWPHVDGADLSVFQPYFSEQYALVIAHIESASSLQKKIISKSREVPRHPCLYVEFPTDRIYYPLRPTAIYANKPDFGHIPIQLYISGYVKPASNPYDEYMQLFHCYTQDTREGIWGYGKAGPIPELFQAGLDDSGWLRFTYMRMNPRPSRLTEDLWFEPYHTKRLSYCERIIRLQESYLVKLIFVFTILLLSFIAGGIAGYLLTGEFLIYGLIGTLNLLTLLALALWAFLGRRKNRAAKQLEGKRKAFIILFTLIYMGLSIVLQLFLLKPFGR